MGRDVLDPLGPDQSGLHARVGPIAMGLAAAGEIAARAQQGEGLPGQHGMAGKAPAGGAVGLRGVERVDLAKALPEGLCHLALGQPVLPAA